MERVAVEKVTVEEVAVEKVIAVLVGDPSGEEDTLTNVLLGDVADALRQRGATRLQVNVVDPDVGPPHGVTPAPDSVRIGAAVSYWVPAAGESPIHVDLLPASDRWNWHSFVVCEALQLQGPPAPSGGGRCVGFTQLVPLTVPAELSWNEWRHRWQGEHTEVAVATQSSFRYVQNVVLRRVNHEAPAFAAIVEESFPLAAAADPAVFYDAEDDEEKYKANLTRMLESCGRFISGDVPIAWTAEYRLE